ncbi:hypothetical protein [EBPR siphovirus 2]|nr:hypothetical protein [EBPR siphovirus 2]
MSEDERTPADARLAQLGEDRHARCRYGLLTEAWSAAWPSTETEDWKPGVAAICCFPVPEPCPPAMKRQWGGAIELIRDCAVCPAFAEVEIKRMP